MIARRPAGALVALEDLRSEAHHQVSVSVHAGLLPGEDGRRAAEALHDGGPRDVVTLQQPLPVVDRRVVEPTQFLEPDEARALISLLGAVVARGDERQVGRFRHADTRHAQVHDLDRAAPLVVVGVAALVEGVEALEGLRQHGRGDVAAGHVDFDLGGLPLVAHLGGAPHHPPVVGNPLAFEARRRLGFQFLVRVTQGFGPDVFFGLIVRRRVVVHQVDDLQPERARHAREGRDDDGVDFEQFGHEARRQGTRAAEGHQGEVLGRNAPLHCRAAHGVGLVPGGDLDHAGGHLVGVHVEPARQAAHGLHGEGLVELHLAARQVERAAREEQVRVGESGFLSALAVADGARVRACAPGADAQPPFRASPGDRPAAGADGDDVDHRHPQIKLIELVPGGALGLAALDHGDVGRGAAPVQGDELLMPREFPEKRGGERARGRPGEHGADGPLRDLARGGDAAVALHDHEGRAAQGILDFFRSVLDIRLDARLDARIEQGGDRAFVLAGFGYHLTRYAHEAFRVFALEGF